MIKFLGETLTEEQWIEGMRKEAEKNGVSFSKEDEEVWSQVYKAMESTPLDDEK